MRVRWHPAARKALIAKELIAAARWYQSKGVDTKAFREAVNSALSGVAELPLRGAPWAGVEPELSVRRCLVRGFPFAIAYQAQHQKIIVLAVAHERRKPLYWLARVVP